MDRDKLIEAYNPILHIAMEEDMLGDGDITSEAIFDENSQVNVHLLVKSKGVLCGLDLLLHTLNQDNNLGDVEILKKEGDVLEPGELVLKLKMPQKSFLKYERVALNIIQHLSGISTKTYQFYEALKESSIEVLDTRKTLLGYRLLQKYAVSVGRGRNHRMGLYDMYLIKDNHIKSAGGVKKAIDKVFDHRQRNNKKEILIEVEVGSLEEVEEAVLNGRVDIIMLDNMNNKSIEQSLKLISESIKVEVSGNINYERLGELKSMKIDYVSVGELTHSVKAVDFSMKIVDND